MVSNESHVWNYDLILREKQEEARLNADSYIKKFRMVQDLRFKIKKNRGNLGLLTAELKKEEESLGMHEVNREISNRISNGLSNSIPFLIGPATADSLLNSRSREYSHINKGQLPFDNMFFNFLEPLPILRPVSFDRNLDSIGMQLYKSANGSYQVNAFYRNPKDGLLETIWTRFAINEVGDNTTLVGGLTDENGKTCFLLDKNNNILHYERMSSDFISKKPKEYAKKMVDISTGAFWNSHSVPIVNLNKIDNREVYQLQNLNINLINYINAHNVTFIKKEREVTHEITKASGKKEKIRKIQPFYLVNVRDEKVEDHIPTGHTWELQWRIYVRGHDREYKNEKGELIKQLWINSYVKGPPTAPWRNQRYAVLAEKLIREKEMRKSFGLEGNI